jgi:hypothetical protein
VKINARPEFHSTEMISEEALSSSLFYLGMTFYGVHTPTVWVHTAAQQFTAQVER